MRELVAFLYIAGAAMTVAGVLRAFLRAKTQKANLDFIKDENDRLASADPLDAYTAALAGDDDNIETSRSEREDVEARIEKMLTEAGVPDPSPSYNDIRLPASFWSRRVALTDAVLQFKGDGALALSGVVVSTVASVWSLYL